MNPVFYHWEHGCWLTDDSWRRTLPKTLGHHDQIKNALTVPLALMSHGGTLETVIVVSVTLTGITFPLGSPSSTFFKCSSPNLSEQVLNWYPHDVHCLLIYSEERTEAIRCSAWLGLHVRQDFDPSNVHLLVHLLVGTGYLHSNGFDYQASYYPKNNASYA